MTNTWEIFEQILFLEIQMVGQIQRAQIQIVQIQIVGHIQLQGHIQL